MIPDKAIICVNTQDEYNTLNEFFKEHLHKEFQSSFSRFVNMCCDLEPSSRRNIVSGERKDYERWIKDYEDGCKSHGKFVPDDASMRFISVADFFAICGADELTQNASPKLDGLL